MTFRDKWSTGWRLAILASVFLTIVVIPYSRFVGGSNRSLQGGTATMALLLALVFSFLFLFENRRIAWTVRAALLPLTYLLLNGHLILRHFFPPSLHPRYFENPRMYARQTELATLAGDLIRTWGQYLNYSNWVTKDLPYFLLALVALISFALACFIFLTLLTLLFSLIFKNWLKKESLSKNMERAIIYLFLCFMLFTYVRHALNQME